jgi:hypothetical protein
MFKQRTLTETMAKLKPSNKFPVTKRIWGMDKPVTTICDLNGKTLTEIHKVKKKKSIVVHAWESS